MTIDKTYFNDGIMYQFFNASNFVREISHHSMFIHVLRYIYHTNVHFVVQRTSPVPIADKTMHFTPIATNATD